VRKKKASKNGRARMIALSDGLMAAVPQVSALSGDPEDFISLLIKQKEDGTCLAVFKRYGPDGGPMVCFGSGYEIAGCLIGLEGAVAANKWRVDRPWEPGEVKGG
jgi:hypothetical protein